MTRMRKSLGTCFLSVLIFGGFILVNTLCVAVAEDAFPSRVITVINPFRPGGGTDIEVRNLMPFAQKYLGQSVVVKSMPGAASTIGITATEESKPDGYTLAGVVIAPEASNNACVLGALIPTLTLGIPGGGVAAVFMGGVMLHGLNPGFELFTRNIDILTTLFFGLFIANFILLFSGSVLSRYAARVTIIPIQILAPSIVALGILSTYSLRSHILDVVAAIVAGIFGYFMKRYGYSTIPFLVAFILSPIAEKSFYQALLLAEGSYLTFVQRPISGTLLALSVLALAVPAAKRYRIRRTRSRGIFNP